MPLRGPPGCLPGGSRDLGNIQKPTDPGGCWRRSGGRRLTPALSFARSGAPAAHYVQPACRKMMKLFFPRYVQIAPEKTLHFSFRALELAYTLEPVGDELESLGLVAVKTVLDFHDRAHIRATKSR